MKQFLALCLFLLLPAAAQATVTSQSTSASFTCTGGTVYPFTFPISDPTALTVIQAGTPLASTAYTIAPVNNNYANGGSVSLNTACSAGTLVLQRITPLTQPVVYTDNMPIPYKTMERGLDKLTEIDQEILLNVLNSVSLGPQVTVTTYCSGTATANTTIYFLAMGGTTSTCTGAAVNLYGIVPPTLKQGQVFDLIATTTDSVGVSSLSGVVTFATPFGATGLTCTIGTTHRCESPVGHYAIATPGSLYFIQMTTQPGETLADVSVSISFR